MAFDSILPEKVTRLKAVTFRRLCYWRDSVDIRLVLLADH